MALQSSSFLTKKQTKPSSTVVIEVMMIPYINKYKEHINIYISKFENEKKKLFFEPYSKD